MFAVHHDHHGLDNEYYFLDSFQALIFSNFKEKKSTISFWFRIVMLHVTASTSSAEAQNILEAIHKTHLIQCLLSYVHVYGGKRLFHNNKINKINNNINEGLDERKVEVEVAEVGGEVVSMEASSFVIIVQVLSELVLTSSKFMTQAHNTTPHHTVQHYLDIHIACYFFFCFVLFGEKKCVVETLNFVTMNKCCFVVMQYE